MSLLKRLERADFSPVSYLLIANLAMFAWSMLASRNLDWMFSAPRYGPSSVVLSYAGASIPSHIFAGEWYRLYAADFLHANLLHLGLNMWALVIFGGYISSLARGWTFTNVYMVSALTGNIGSILWQCQRYGVAFAPGGIGASGAVFGLGGYLFGRFQGASDPGARQIRQQLVFWLLINFAIGAQIPQIDHAGHIGGLIGGYFVARFGGRKTGSSVARVLRSPRLGLILIAIAVMSMATAIWRWHHEYEDALVFRRLAQMSYETVRTPSVSEFRELQEDLAGAVESTGKYSEHAVTLQDWVNYEYAVHRGERPRTNAEERSFAERLDALAKAMSKLFPGR